eukprot:1667344-Karenia_brevis.AAC.1
MMMMLIRHCLELFDAVVTPSVLYCAGSWAMTKNSESMLQRAQRKMLRKIVQVARKTKQSQEP